jgi:hypothetical protein
VLLAAAAPCLTVVSVITVWGLTWTADWYGMLVEHAVYWYTCAFFTPVIWWASERVVLNEGRLTPGLVVQGCAAPLFFAGHVTLLASARWFTDAGSPEIGSLWQAMHESGARYAALDLATWSALVAVSHAVIFHDRAAERGRRAARLGAQLVDARLQALQQRLQPHLLFNALHAISALMHRDVELADRTLGDLSELLRTTLDQAGRQQMPLSAELALLRTYLRIEQTRFADRLVVRFDVQPDTLDGLVPTLVLQPIVENAIKHGIAKNPDTGHIDISARRVGEKLWLEVRDDGAGLSENAYTALQKGVGVSTTRARLQHLYGPDFRFEFHTGPRGLGVIVMVPWRSAATMQNGGADGPTSEDADRGRRAARA